MRRHFEILCFFAWAAVLLADAAVAQTIGGSSLSHRSSGSGSGNWTLSQNGYVGTYFTLAAPGPVTINVSAAGVTSDNVLPRMNIVVAGEKTGFDVGSGFNNYQDTFDLPAGTYFVRTELNNETATAARQLTVGNVTISGASSVSNTANQTTNNANALAAADTYIANFRKGPAAVNLVGVAPGTQVHVKLKQHDFRFGTAVGGTSVGSINTYLNNSTYSNFLLNHFNAVTPGNAGKWAYNEGSPDVVTMSGVDRLLQYAEANDLRVRMHNLLWADSQQPSFATTLLNSAAAGNTTAKTNLRDEISERIDYYVGNNDANAADDRARRYVEMDLLNEHVHQPKYWDVYQATGIASMFTEAASAVSAAGSDAKLFLNEYNVLQYGSDNYGNWYRQDVEEIKENGGAISGIGVQYYPFSVADSNAHSPARIQQIFQNLSVTGLPIALTEFGVQTNNGTTVNQAATYLADTMRMTFGSPDATTFVLWGFWANDLWSQAPLAALMDANWNQTAPGLAYDNLMNQWKTDVNLNVGADGKINFSGFYGKYELTLNGETIDLDLAKGTTSYSLVVAPGDYNADGTVDSSDYILWRDTLDSSTDLRADGNGDLVIDNSDYDVWRSHFGATYASAAGVGVPEPGAAMAVLGLLLGQLWRRRTSARSEAGLAEASYSLRRRACVFRKR
jgi:GH35 family endo-1,4-beta-xylanase